MGVSQGRHVPVLSGELGHPIEAARDLRQEDVQGVAVDDEVGVVGDEARRRAQVDDAASRRRRDLRTVLNRHILKLIFKMSPPIGRPYLPKRINQQW